MLWVQNGYALRSMGVSSLGKALKAQIRRFSDLILNLQSDSDEWQLKRLNLTRSVIHLSGLSVVFLRKLVGVNLTLSLIMIVTFIYLISELLRLRNKSFPLINLTIKASRNEERNQLIIRPVYYAVGIAASMIIFPENIGNSAITIVTLGDCLAGLSGTIIGRNPIPYNRDKTIEGSLVGFISAFLVSCVFVSVHVAFLGALTGAFAESCDRLLDDNLAVPLASGLVMSLLSLPFP